MDCAAVMFYEWHKDVMEKMCCTCLHQPPYSGFANFRRKRNLDFRCQPIETISDSWWWPIMPDHSNIVRNRANGTLRDSNLLTSADRKTSHEGANTIPVTHQHHQEQQEGPLFSGYGGSKESFDFLSVSSGVTPAADNDVNRSGYNMESGVKCQMHYQHSVVQHNRPIPSSSPQNHFPSNSYRDRAAPVSVGMPCTPPQGNLHVPQYFGNPFAPGPMFNTTMSVQQPQRKQQQRQQIWTAQLAKQFGPGPLLSSQIAKEGYVAFYTHGGSSSVFSTSS
ncbi:hypothetical protein Cgig2_008955 [Carnegiea gigantea]|uniref:Uncharacterized protein n=1 Tax=Carnegiea gigantea TaxID=171969 RepID=A0A9Q1JMW8_9CARY|nr:hypothetical protein Cgig2_008955 [Carnegiea gigantea]